MSTPYTTYTSNCEKVDVRFTTHYDASNISHVIGVTGSYKYLGSWDPMHALLLKRRGIKGCWSSVVKLPLSQYFEWKLIVIDRQTGKVQKWEEYPNRWNWIDKGPIEIIVGWNSKELIRCSSCSCLVGTCCCTTIYSHLAPFESLVDVTFRVIYNTDTDDEVIALIGSSRFLGDWDPTVSRLFPGHNNPVLTIHLPMNTCFEWKLAILDKRQRKVIRWEECENRALKLQTCPLEVGVAWSQVAEIGYKCYWLDPHWVISPCPCGRRYCCNTDTGGKDQINNLPNNSLETPGKAVTCRPARDICKDHQNWSCEKHDKSVHFPDNPVTQVIERGENSGTSSDDSLQKLYIELDSLSLDESSYNNCSSLQRLAQQVNVPKNTVNNGESSLAENINQERKHNPSRTLELDNNSDSSGTLLTDKHNRIVNWLEKIHVKRTDEGSLSLPGKVEAVKHIDNNEIVAEKPGHKKQTNESDSSPQPKKQTKDSSLPKLEKLGPEQQTETGDFPLNKWQRTDKKINSSKLDSENQQNNPNKDGNISKLENIQPRHPTVNLSVPAKQPEKPFCCSDLSLPARQPEKPVSCSDLSVPAKQPEKPVNCSDLSLPARQPEKPVSCSDLSVPAKQPEKLVRSIDLSVPARQPEKQVSCSDLSVPAKQPGKPVSCSDLSLLTKQPEKPISCSDLSQSTKKSDKLLKKEGFSLTAKQPQKLIVCCNLPLPGMQPQLKSSNLPMPLFQPEKGISYCDSSLPERHSERVVISLPEKQPDKLLSCGDLSLPPKQPEKLSEKGNNSSLPAKQPEKVSKSVDLSLPAKQPNKLVSCSDYALQLKQHEKLSSCEKLSLTAKQPNTLPESGNLSLLAKHPEKLVVCSNLSLPVKQPKKLSESGNLSQPKQKLSESGNLSQTKKKLAESGNLSQPANQLKLSESANLSQPDKKTMKPPKSGNLSQTVNQLKNLSESCNLSQTAKQSNKLVTCEYSSLSSKQPERLSKSVDAPLPAKKPKKLVSYGNSSPSLKQSGGLSSSVDLSLPAKSPETLSESSNLSLPAKKQSKTMVTCGDLAISDEQKENSNAQKPTDCSIQDQANSRLSRSLFLTASSALAAIMIAGYRYLRK